jgi:hypothetical protein
MNLIKTCNKDNVVERPVIALALTKRSAPNAPSTPSTSVIPIVSKNIVSQQLKTAL